MNARIPVHGPARMALRCISFCLLAAIILPPQVYGAVPRPLLAAAYGELCTTCDAYLLCEPTEGAPRDARVLHVHKHSFWGQIGTIWTWLRHLFQPVRPDTRHLSVYRPSDDGSWTPDSQGRVTLDLRSLRIEYPVGWVDRTDGGWHDSNDDRIGVCRAVGPEAVYGETR